MEIEDNPNDHVPASVGGISGHLFRRIVHVGMVIFPLLYYFWEGLDMVNFGSLAF